jgi:hypothetical protein
VASGLLPADGLVAGMVSSGMACILVVAVTSAAGEGWSSPDSPELQTLIRRITTENRLWGQKRIQAELSRLGFTVSARTVAKYMNRRGRRPSPGWRKFLKRHESSIWACDFFCVQTILFQTLYVFFVIRHVKPGNPARCSNAISNGGVGGPASSGVPRVGSIAAVSDSRP